MSKDSTAVISGRLVPITQVGDREYAVDRKAYDAYMEGKGITAEVRQQIKDANTELIGDLLKFAADKVLEQKDPKCKVVVEIATGKGSDLTVGVQGMTEHRKPQDGTAIINYGSCFLRAGETIPLSLRYDAKKDQEPSVVAVIGDLCEKKFGKKK